MSGFVAALRSYSDAGLADSLRKMSRQIEHRGDTICAETFSDRCGAEARYREASGFRVQTAVHKELVLVFDGILFNRKELGAIVNADKAASDAEIVLLGYETFGANWITRLDGSFSLMIADLQVDEVTLARDRFGHRPLYFAQGNSGIWVGSEIKAILAAPGVQRSVNNGALAASIGYGITQGPETLFSDISKCVPGFVFKINVAGNYSASCYFTPEPAPSSTISLDDARKHVWSMLRNSVNSYTTVCPEAGLLLSGGVDSALLACHLADATDRTALAVSFGAADWEDEETAGAKRIAEKVGLNFSRAFVASDADLLDPLRKTIWCLEEPSRFENALALEMTCREASGHCTGLLTGEAADSIFGNQHHHAARRVAQISRLPEFIRATTRTIPANRLPAGQLRSLALYSQYDSIDGYLQCVYANCTDLVPGATQPVAMKYSDVLRDSIGDWSPAAQYTYLNLMEYQHCWLERMEKITSAAALECFQPFQRNEILQYGMNLPDELRVHNGVRKPILRALAADKFGRSFAYDRKKQFAAPMALWLKNSGQLRDAVLQLKNSQSRIRDYLDGEILDKHLTTYEKHGALDGLTSRTIFRMLSFEIWLDLFI